MEQEAVVEKFSPSKLKVSGKFTAILACLLGGEEWTNPPIAELCITADNFLMARMEGDIGFNDFVGSGDDLARNICGVIETVGLNEEEKKIFGNLAAQNIQVWNDFDVYQVVTG